MASVGHNAQTEPAGNWIAVSRDMRDHPIVGFGQPVKPADPKRGSYSRTEAWMDLIMEARFQPGQINNKGKVVMLLRGQLMAARAWLAARWNWSENAVRWFLDKLEKEVMITRNHHHSNTKDRRHFANVLTIEKYDVFQTAKELLGLLTAKETTNQPPINHQSTTNQPPESNKETKEQYTESPRAAQKQDGVHVNGEAIYVRVKGKTLKFPYSEIDYWGALNCLKSEKAREFVEMETRGWVVDGFIPDRPSSWLQSQMKHRKTRETIAEIRIETAKKQAAPRYASRRAPRDLNEMTAEELAAYYEKGNA